MIRILFIVLSLVALAACADKDPLPVVSGGCYALNLGPPAQWQPPANLPCPSR
jgi:hypothetical protein